MMDSWSIVEKFRESLEPIRRDFNSFWYNGTPFRFLEFVDYVHAPYASPTLNISEEGFRGSTIPRGRVKGRMKIACFGSSVIAGVPNCSDSEILSVQLAEALTAVGVPCDVANFGLMCSTIKHDLNLALRKLSEYEFDAVVLLNGYNDLYNAERGNIWQHYDGVEESLVAAFERRDMALDPKKLLRQAVRRMFAGNIDHWREIKDPIHRARAAQKRRLVSHPPAPPCFEFLEKVYLTHLELFSTLCRFKKLPLVYSFQPSLHSTTKPLSAYENALVETGVEFGEVGEMREVRRTRFQAAYSDIRTKAYQLLGESGLITDLDGAMAEFGAEESAFYDYCHLLAPACKAAGKRLADSVASALR